jgi:hypothetical protein
VITRARNQTQSGSKTHALKHLILDEEALMDNFYFNGFSIFTAVHMIKKKLENWKKIYYIKQVKKLN